MRYKKGDKVVPHSKTVVNYGGLDVSGSWRRAVRNGLGYLFVTRYTEVEGVEVLVLNDSSIGGDYFLPSDVTPYETAKITEGDFL